MDHPAAEVWKYSPRQVAAFLFFGRRRKRREMIANLALHTLAARGKPEQIRDEQRRLEKDL